MYKITCFVLCLLLLPLALGAELRVEKRSYQEVDYTYQIDYFYYFYGYKEEEARYLSGEPEVIECLFTKDRLINWEGSDSGWEPGTTLEFNPDISYNAIGKHIEYHISPWNRHRIEQYDQQNRLISIIRYDYYFETLVYSVRDFYYGNHSSPDSIISSYRGSLGQQEYSKYVSSYDAAGYKLQELKYASSDSLQWTPDQKAVFYHSSSTLPTGFEYRLYNPIFDVYWSAYAPNSLNFYHPGLYGSAIVDSILISGYEEGAWVPIEVDKYEYTVHQDRVNIGISSYELAYMNFPDYYPRQFQMSFTPEGYFKGQSWAIDDGFGPPTWGEITYTWEIAVANDDEIAPSPGLVQLWVSPNPFSTEVTIKYQLLKDGETRLEIFNLRGQLVKAIVNQMKAHGTYQAKWDGRDQSGKAVSSGLYFTRLTTPGKTTTAKLVLLK